VPPDPGNRVDTMRGTLRRAPRAPDPVDKPDAKRAKKKADASFAKLPHDLQKKIFELVYREAGISIQEQIKRLCAIRLMCRCTNEWARLALASHVMKRELERRKELAALLESATFSAVAKAILSKDASLSIFFHHLVVGTDGKNALDGLKVLTGMFDKEEKWLRKCHAHTEAGNVSLEGVYPDED